MAPSAKVIKQALVDGTCAVFREDPDAISVNKVRRHVTDELELGEDFFNSGEWKQNSKLVIKETVVRESAVNPPEGRHSDVTTMYRTSFTTAGIQRQNP
jgi:hypothetical protein